MASSKERRTSLLLLVAAIAAATSGVYLLLNTHAMLFGIIAILLSAVLIRQLMGKVGKSERELQDFVAAIKYKDFSRRFLDSSKTKQQAELAQHYDQIMQQLQQLELAHQEQSQLLQAVIQQVNSGILLLDNQGNIRLRNNAINRQLAIPGLQSAKQINERYPQLTQYLTISHANCTITLDNNQYQLNSQNLRVGSHSYQLILLNNIQDEMESAEIESWQKLIRVLTHEISNSITPISSLANTAETLLEQSVKPGLAQIAKLDDDLIETIDDIHQSIAAIARRGEGLTDFVAEYRKLTHVKEADKQQIPVCDLLHQINSLLIDELTANQVSVSIDIEPPALTIHIDQALIEQVLINIYINAIHAMNEQQVQKRLHIKAYINDYSKAVIEINDNGCGMTKEALPRIFTPFYTTKQSGSGIGLALARQIMHKHKGAIIAESEDGAGSTFRLIF